MGLGNTPRRTTVVALEARKSFAFGLRFFQGDTEQVHDLTGATVRMVAAAPAHKGGAVVINKTAATVDLALGLVQFELQAADLDLAAGEYPFSVTLVSANSYSTPVLKGVLDLRENPDPDTTGTFAGINPSTNLAVSVEQGDVVEVRIDKVDGLYVVVSQMIAEFDTNVAAKLLAAGQAEDNAAAWAGAAADSAAEASDSELAAAQSATNAAASAADASQSRAFAENAAAAALEVQTNTQLSQTAAINAQSSATAAAASSTNAATSATAASNAATAADASADAAAQSAQDAEAIVTGDLDPVIAGRILDPEAQAYDAVGSRIGGTAPMAHAHPTTDITGLDAWLEENSGGGLFRGGWSTVDVIQTFDFADGTIPPLFTKPTEGFNIAQATVVPLSNSTRPNPPAYSKAVDLYAWRGNATGLSLDLAGLGLADIVGVRAWMSANTAGISQTAWARVLRNGVVDSSIVTPMGWTQITTDVDGDDVVLWQLYTPGGSQSEVHVYVAGIEILAAAQPYMTGEYVVHNGKLWKSDTDNNAGVPGVAGWTEVPLDYIEATGTVTKLHGPITQAEYDALGTPDPDTLYVIVG